MVYPTVHFVQSDQFKKDSWDIEEVRNYLKKNSFSNKSDSIFGHKVEVFADLSHHQELSEELLNQYIDKAKETVERDFNNPPILIEEKESVFFRVINFVLLCALIILVIILLIRNRYN